MADEKNKDAVLVDMEAKIQALTELVEKQSAALEKLTATTPAPKEVEKLETPKDIFEVNKKKYRFKVPKYLVPGDGGGPMLAIEALKNPAELERLVTIRSGVVELAT